MPRKEVYQLRLTKDEKDELADRARKQGISIAKLMRRALGLGSTERDLDPSSPEGRQAMREVVERDEYNVRVNELARTMPRSNAERLARKEMS